MPAGGCPHRTPRPSPPPAPHFPNPGDLGAWLRHGHRGRPRVQPQPRRRSGTGAGEGKMPGLAVSPRVSGAAHPSWQRPGLQPPWAELKGQPPAWAWRHLGGAGRSERPEGGRRRGTKGLQRGEPARLGPKTWLSFQGSSVTKLNPLTLTLYPNDSSPGQRNKSSYVFTSQAIPGTEGLRSLRSTLEL